MSCCSDDGLVVLEDGTLVARDVEILSFDAGLLATVDPTNPNLVHVSLGGPGAVSLQLAYDGGETIITDAQGAIDFVRGPLTADGESVLTLLDANANPGRTVGLLSITDTNVSVGGDGPAAYVTKTSIDSSDGLKVVRQNANGAGAAAPGGVALRVQTGQTGPSLCWFQGGPRGGPVGFYAAIMSDTCSFYTNGALASDGGSAMPGGIALLGWTFMIGSNSDIGAGAKAAAYVSFINDIVGGLDHFHGMRGGDAGFRFKIKMDGGYVWGDAAGGTNFVVDQTATAGELGFTSQTVLGLKLSASPTGGVRLKSDEPGAADTRPVFDFSATQNIPSGFDRLLMRVGENDSNVAADIRMLLNSDGTMRVRGTDAAYWTENTAGTFQIVLGIAGATYTSLIDNVTGSGIKFITTGNPGAGVLAFQFSDAGGTLFQVDGDGDAVVTKDIEAVGGYRKTVGPYTHALLANQTGIVLTFGITGNAVVAFRAGSITGISGNLDAAVTAGTLTIDVHVNGGPSVFVLTFTNADGVTKIATQGKDIDLIAAGDLITVTYSTTAGFTGPVNLTVGVEIEE